jgi:hypothetical protein
MLIFRLIDAFLIASAIGLTGVFFYSIGDIFRGAFADHMVAAKDEPGMIEKVLDAIKQRLKKLTVPAPGLVGFEQEMTLA